MRSQSPAFSFYPKDWLSDANVKAMTLEAKGAYIELLGIYWLEDGLPAEPERLARLVGIPLWRFRRLWPLIEPCFQVVENRLVQKRLEHERAKQQAYTISQRAKGLKGGRPIMVGIKANLINENEKPVVSPEKAEGGPEKSLPSPSPSPSSKNVGTNVGTYLPPPDVRAEQSLRTERWKMERSLLAVVQQIAERENKQAKEVMLEVTSYESKQGNVVSGRVNPALLSDERLEKSLEDATAWLEDLSKTK